MTHNISAETRQTRLVIELSDTRYTSSCPIISYKSLDASLLASICERFLTVDLRKENRTDDSVDALE